MFLLDGQPRTDFSENPSWTWTTSAAEIGSHSIEVKARDNLHNPDGDSSKAIDFVISAPPNNPPAVADLVADLASPQILGTTVTWTAEASDPEADPISYRFMVNDTPVSDWQSQNQFAWTATEPGTSLITAQVRDDQREGPEGENGNRSAEFTINAPVPEAAPVVAEVAPAEVVPVMLNESPSITGLSADKESPQILGTTVNWTAEASDPEADPISYRFLVNDTPASEWQSQNLFAWTATVPGPSWIMVQAKDNQHEGPQGENGNRSVEFTINAPAPEIKPVEVTTAANVTNATENVTEPVAIAPETVIPPAEENITTPIAPENVTTPVAPANETATAAPVVVNQTPILNSLTPDIASPQKPGVTVTWTANATDADKDPLFFRFFLNGPATNGAWQPETDWSDANTWTWETSAGDTGENQFKAQVRDGKHADVDSFDSELSGYFTLSEPTLNISGTAYEDKNSNSQIDSGEALVGWTIQLVKPDSSQVSVITKDDGSYRFEQLKAGSYTVSEALPSGWKAIQPRRADLIRVDLKDSDANGLDFANKLTLYTISGLKYNDLNGNGAFDGEPGMEGWSIQLSKDGSVVNTTTTGKDGAYKFVGLAPGSYSVAEVEQSGWTRTAPKEGSYAVDLLDSDVAGKDFGNHGSFAISGTSFVDTNGNGAKDGDETGQADRSLQLSQNGNVINATSTGQDGSYAFRNLAPALTPLARWQ